MRVVNSDSDPKLEHGDGLSVDSDMMVGDVCVLRNPLIESIDLSVMNVFCSTTSKLEIGRAHV